VIEMRKVKTHTFNGTKYQIDFVTSIEGVTDTKERPKEPLGMDILDGNDFKAFHSAFHESLEASGFCDKCLHIQRGDKRGTSRTVDAARLLWRLKYRRKET
jgi:hypothetical protein